MTIFVVRIISDNQNPSAKAFSRMENAEAFYRSKLPLDDNDDDIQTIALFRIERVDDNRKAVDIVIRAADLEHPVNPDMYLLECRECDDKIIKKLSKEINLSKLGLKKN